MKHRFLCVVMLITACQSFGQQMTMSAPPAASFQQQINDVFAHVDLTQVPNGLLEDYGVPYINLKAYNGQLSPDNKCDEASYGMAYASLYSMAVNPNDRLPDPAGYRTIMASADPEVLLLGALHQVYYAIDSLAVSHNLLKVTGSQLYDVPGRSGSPYQRNELFLVAPTQNYIRGATFKCRLDSRLFYQNAGKTVQGWYVDLGAGYQPILPDQVLENTTLSSGLIPIKVKLLYTDGSVYESHCDVAFEKTDTQKFSAVNPDMVTHLFAREAWQGKKAGATVYVSLACGHQKLIKPFIWCEGYNPEVGSIDNRLFYSDAVDRIDFASQTIGNISISDYLEQEGYDLVVIDYDDGGDYLRRNALVIEEAIRWVNAEKAKNGSEEKNVVIGQSMGGMIARCALRRMEMNGENHETKTYISFDTGHLGTNMPLSVQYALKHVAGMRVVDRPLRDFVAKVDDAEKLLNLPASRDMLIYYAPGFYLFDEWYPRPDLVSNHDSYYSYQNEVLGMPQQCEVLAIANGALDAAGGQPFGNHDKLIELQGSLLSLWYQFVDAHTTSTVGAIYADIIGTSIIIASGYRIKADISLWALPDLPSDYEDLYKGKIIVIVANVIPLVASSSEVKIKDVVGLDASPGGWAGFDENPLILKKSIPGLNTFKLNTWSFTPTVSTLNYKGTSASYHEVNNAYVDFSAMPQYLQQNSLGGVQNYSGMTQGTTYPGLSFSLRNTAHTYFNPEIAPFMVYHLVGDNSFLNISTLHTGEVYNYGKKELHYTTDPNSGIPRKTGECIRNNLTIESGAILAVNHYDGLAYNALLEDGFKIPAICKYGVDVSNCTSFTPIEVRVKSGGKLRLGNGLGRIGEMNFNANTNLVIESGAILELNADANLAFRKNAKLILEPGAIVYVYAGSRIYIDYESQLVYGQDAHIYTEGSTSELALGGTVYLLSGAEFSLDHSLSTESGYIRILTESQEYGQPINFVGESGSSVTLNAKNNQDVMLVLDEGATMLVSSTEFVPFNMTNMKAYFGKNSSALFMNKINANNCVIETDQYVKGIACRDDAMFLNCTVRDVPILGSYGQNINGKLNLISSQFYGSNIRHGQFRDAIVEIRGGSFSIDNCHFNSVNQNIILSTNLVFPSVILNSTLNTNNSYAPALTFGLNDYSDVEIWLTGNTFKNLYQNVNKLSGKLSLKCNSFGNVSGSGNVMVTSGTLSMTSTERSGYNVFNANNTANAEIYDGYLKLNKGYNQFKYNQTAIVGQLATTCNVANNCKLAAAQNMWGTVLNPPSASSFGLLSANGYQVSVKTIPTSELEPCGSKDPPLTGGGSTGPGEVNLTGIIKSAEGKSHIPIEKAIQLGIDRMELINQAGNDREAIAIFNAIFESTSTYPLIQVKEDLQTSLALMKSTLEHGVSTGIITGDQDLPVQQYLRALNRMSKPGLQNAELQEQFLLEIDKMHLFRVFNRIDLAINHLLQLEKCGLPKKQQLVVNYWKSQLFTTIPQGSMKLPVAEGSSIYFGSYFQQFDQLTYAECSGKKLSDSNEDSREIIIYPNPSDDIVNIKLNTNDRSLTWVLNDLSGKVIQRIELNNNKSISVRGLQPGIYIYQVFRNNETLSQGKLMVE